jgi:hypothetical protein
VQGRFEEVPLPGILGVEQFEELKHKAVVDVGFCDVRVEVLALDEAKEELVHNLDMRPGDFQDRLVLFRIKRLALRVHWGRDGPEQVFGEHANNDRVHGLGDDLTVVGDVIEELMEGQSLDFLRLHVGAGVIEIEDDIALLNLLHEEVFTAPGGDLVESGELFELAVG